MNERYSRQVLFNGIGPDGQEKLRNSQILIVGCGALGASHAEMLARAGVGKLRIVDRDVVEYTNLQRQTLFTEDDAYYRVPKAVAAKTRIAEVNSDVEVEAVVADVNNSNVESYLDGCDVVLDGTDNFQVRYLINDACVKHSRTWIYGAAVSGYGTTMTIIPSQTPCLRCIFEEMPDAGSSPTCDTAGVIMPIISSISSIQVTEAIKLLVGKNEELHGSLIQIDVWANDWRKIKLSGPLAECPTCGKGKFEFLDAESAEFAAVLCGRNAVQVAPSRPVELDLDELSSKLCMIAVVNQNEYLMRFSPDDHEITIFRDGRAIISGTEDISLARSLYAKYVGN